jgi:hypothetical protein
MKRKREGVEKVQKELEELHAWIRAIADYVKAVDPPPAFVELERAIDATLQRGDLRGMKSIARFMTDMARAGSSEQVQQLDRQLRSKFGKGLREASAADLKRVENILQKGRVESEEDYHILMARVDEICSDASKKEEVEQINAILAQHDDPQRRI